MQLTSFYQFTPVRGIPMMRARTEHRARQAGLLGTVLLAEEGINGSLAGPHGAADSLLDWLALELGAQRWVVNRQEVEEAPFRRLKVRIRPEIIRFDRPDPGLAEQAGEHVTPQRWDELIGRGDVRLVDTRNDYEVRLGSFTGAENPSTDSFRDFTEWVESNLDPARDRNVAMFCTGGVRCEKASAWMRSRGFENVFQLEGGILSYLDHKGGSESHWQGECFVFDDRVSLDHRLQPTGRMLCQACRRPADGLDRDGLPPVANGACAHCTQALTPQRVAGLRERARQVRLAIQEDRNHLGPQDPVGDS